MSSSNSLPPEWEAKIDTRTGKTYYINHHDRTTSWEHPSKSKKHGGTTSKSSSFKQANGTSKHVHVDIPMQDFSNRTRGNSLTIRSSKIQDSSLTMPTDEDEAVARISAMFPTVSDAHIRLLMKNCRYMKSIFPQAEETMILDILSNNDNNIQKSSDTLRNMGFEKKDSLKISQQKHQAKLKQKETGLSPPISPIPLPRIKSPEEKAKVRGELQKEHKEMPEQLITIALESVDFDKERASTLLKDTTLNMKTEEGKILESSEVDNQGAATSKDIKMPISQSRQSLKSLLKSEKNDKEMNTFNRVVENIPSSQKSSYLSSTKGPNPVLAKGNNENLLLEDYVNWNGPNSTLCKGPQSLAKGPNASYILERSALACGPNSNYKKGPNKSLVNGSIFQQMKNAVPVGGGVRGE